MEKCCVNCFELIEEYDNVFTQQELDKIREISYSPKWEITNSNPEQGERTFWRMNLMQEKFFNTTLLRKVEKIVGRKLELEDVYLNGTTTSMASAPHIDAREHNVYVFLAYLNPEWHIQWGGQTIFLNRYYDVDTQEMRGDVSSKNYFPKFNFATFFPGNIVHIAEAPTRDYYGLRITLAYRVKLKS